MRSAPPKLSAQALRQWRSNQRSSRRACVGRFAIGRGVRGPTNQACNRGRNRFLDALRFSAEDLSKNPNFATTPEEQTADGIRKYQTLSSQRMTPFMRNLLSLANIRPARARSHFLSRCWLFYETSEQPRDVRCWG